MHFRMRLRPQHISNQTDAHATTTTIFQLWQYSLASCFCNNVFQHFASVVMKFSVIQFSISAAGFSAVHSGGFSKLGAQGEDMHLPHLVRSLKEKYWKWWIGR